MNLHVTLFTLQHFPYCHTNAHPKTKIKLPITEIYVNFVLSSELYDPVGYYLQRVRADSNRLQGRVGNCLPYAAEDMVKSDLRAFAQNLSFG